MGPRIAEEGSFEQEYGTKWKALVQEFQEKEKALKVEMVGAIEKLQTQMEMARYDYETEMLRQRKLNSSVYYLFSDCLNEYLQISMYLSLTELRQREIDHEQQKLRWESRGGGFGGGNNGGFNQNGMGGSGGGGGPITDGGMNQMDTENGGGLSFNLFDSAFASFRFLILFTYTFLT